MLNIINIRLTPEIDSNDMDDFIGKKIHIQALMQKFEHVDEPECWDIEIAD
jgi:hypothetical protein